MVMIKIKYSGTPEEKGRPASSEFWRKLNSHGYKVQTMTVNYNLERETVEATYNFADWSPKLPEERFLEKITKRLGVKLVEYSIGLSDIARRRKTSPQDDAWHGER